jgi:hypothetical protein
MKNLLKAVLSVCLTLCSLCAFAQTPVPINEPDYNKPKLFEDLPERINFDPASFINLFQARVGESVTITLMPDNNFTGVVVSASNDLKALSVVIRLTNRGGARLTFTKITDADGSIKYIGRIISLQHGDSYEIVFENNRYYFKKKGIYELIEE